MWRSQRRCSSAAPGAVLVHRKVNCSVSGKRRAKMKASFLTLLLASMVSPLMGSCKDNEEPMFCNGASYIPQVYCDDANLEEWQCSQKENVRCACGPGYARTKHKTCEPEGRCAIHGKGPATTNTPAVEGTDSEQLNDIGKKALQLMERYAQWSATTTSLHRLVMDQKRVYYLIGPYSLGRITPISLSRMRAIRQLSLLAPPNSISSSSALYSRQCKLVKVCF
ncbi:uncharacterized protein LOC142590374 isoform X9 [Dermacentor variabilis]|uniref:uncharacterized protein LOC142590374 isoform X9 n=1 Tax=Dermacentor variabilis TaxID=34621 RepID=UPI003F5C82E1